MTNWILWLGLALLSPTVELGGIVSIGTPFLALGSFLCGLQFCKRDFQMILGVPGALAAAYLMCVLMSVVWSPNLFVSGFRGSYHIYGFILFLGLLQRQNVQSDYKRLQFWAFALTCAGLVIALDFLIVMGTLTVQGRLSEAFADRVTGGVMSLKWAGSNTIAAAILSSLYPGLILRRNLGRFAKCAVGAMLLAILATLSRNSAICVLTSVVAYACLSGRASSTIGALMGISIVVCTGLWFVDADVFDLIITSRVESAEVGSMNGRADCWQAAWSVICRKWPCPVGFYGSIPTLGHTAHNLILTDLLEIGIWGTVIHLMLFASIAGELWMARCRRRRAGQLTNDLNILLSGLLCIFINLQFEDPQFTQPYIVCNWIFMGICIAAARLPNDLNSYFASAACLPSVSDLRNRRGPRIARKPLVRVASGNRLSW